MAMTVRKNFTENIAQDIVEQIGQEVRRCVNKLRASRPVRVMHSQEEPGGRVTYHWDIETSQAESTAHQPQSPQLNIAAPG